MSNEIIICFNGQECIYAECPIYSAETDMCKLELFKKTGARGKPIQRTIKDEPQLKPSYIEGKYINVTGTIVSEPETKTGTRADGTEWRMKRFDMEVDGEGVTMALWDSFADADIVKGKKVSLEGVKVNKPYQDRVQLGTAKHTKIHF